MSDELPKGWATAALAQLTETPKQDIISGPFGSNLKSDEYVEAGVPIIRLQNVDRNRFLEKNMRFITPQKARELSAHTFQAGDIVITKLGAPLGKACAIPESLPDGIVVADVVRVRIDESRFSKSYVLFAINSPAVVNQINSEMMGSTRPRVNLNNIRGLEIPLAPLAEQRRIVAKLEKLMGHVAACQQRLSRISTLVKRFRQSVLAAACSGRLTVDWRDARRQSDEWLIHNLSELGSVTGGVTKNAKRQTLRLQVPYLRVANVYENRLELGEVLQIGVTPQEFERTQLVKDDLLFVEGNGSLDQIGRVALWDGSVARCVHQNHLIKFRAGKDLVPAYVLLQMMAPEGRSQLMEKATSSAGLNTLSISKISAVNLPVPSLAEQEEIVRRVESFFSLADRIEARFAEGRKRVNGITQAILGKAFSGELVPTEFELAKAEGRSFESAEELLERIRRNGEPGKKK
jgi:type I restriction enzyme S subunit